MNTAQSRQPENPSRRDVWRMFDRISSRYDLLNRLLSLRQDVRWRKKLSGYLPEGPDLLALDLATGTADVLISLCRYSKQIKRGFGVDMAREMLRLGRQKLPHENSVPPVLLFPADATLLPFADNSMDVVTIAFGIRNLTDVSAGLAEMRRVLKTRGRVLILEFSLPQAKWFRSMYLFYFRNILPVIGGIISGDREAYGYLNKTVETFPYGNEFLKLLKNSGFREVRAIRLSFGIASIYIGNNAGG